MIITLDQVTETGTVAAEPVTTSYAKNHLRVDSSSDDTLIGNLITAAREYAENYCQRSFVQHTYRADLAYFADFMELPGGPVQSISGIKYYNTASPQVLTTLDSTVYGLQHNVVFRNSGESWESHAVRPDAVQITYVTGYADTASPADTVANVPESVKAAILLVAADLYEYREGKIVGTIQSDNPTVHALLHKYRIYR